MRSCDNFTNHCFYLSKINFTYFTLLRILEMLNKYSLACTIPYTYG